MTVPLFREHEDLGELALRDMALGRDLAGAERLAMRQRFIRSVLPIEVAPEPIIHRQ